MEKERVTRRKSVRTVQDFLSLGYLYLLLLGITSDSIYYGLLGVNILSYSNVLDVLLSPIVRLTSSVSFPITIFLIPGLLYLFLGYVKKVQAKRGADSSPSSGLSISMPLTQLWMIFSALVIFSGFIGYGLGGGFAIKNSMESGNIRVKHRITFQDNKTLDVRLVGNNSSYVFYIVENKKVVTISPLKENVRSIEKIEK